MVETYPKSEKQAIIQQPKLKPPSCLSCKKKNWLEFDEGFYCQNCHYFINKQIHQNDNKVRRQDH